MVIKDFIYQIHINLRTKPVIINQQNFNFLYIDITATNPYH